MFALLCARQCSAPSSTSTSVAENQTLVQRVGLFAGWLLIMALARLLAVLLEMLPSERALREQSKLSPGTSEKNSHLHNDWSLCQT